MSRQDDILQFISRKNNASGQQIATWLGISRQAVNKHIKQLMLSGKIVKQGTTRAARYSVESATEPTSVLHNLSRTYILDSITEDRVFEEISGLIQLKRNLSSNSLPIVQYAFTEMLNNAIDHSQSSNCRIEVVINSYDCSISIRDFGIGIFENIYKTFGLADEVHAAGELLKGKTTTMAERHSGEGIFFTSKAVDRFNIRSHRIELNFDNKNNDVSIFQKKYFKGTLVSFTVSKKSKKILADVFYRFAPEEFDFKFRATSVQVKLFSESYISRSEARRMLTNLDKFDRINLDFKGVKSIGQGFADEIFRVFLKQHANLEIKYVNCIPEVEQMIRHVVDN